MSHILQVIDQTGNQAAPEITSYKEAEEAEESVHEADVVGNARDDCLLTVWTDGLHRCGLKHLSLQHSYCSSCSGRSQDRGCVAPHVDEVTGRRAHLSRHRVRVVTGRRRVMGTLWWHRHRHWHRHGHSSVPRNMWREEVWLWAFIRRGTIIWRQRLPLLWLGSSYGLPILFLNEWCTGSSRVWRRRITRHIAGCQRMVLNAASLTTNL